MSNLGSHVYVCHRISRQFLVAQKSFSQKFFSTKYNNFKIRKGVDSSNPNEYKRRSFTKPLYKSLDKKLVSSSDFSEEKSFNQNKSAHGLIVNPIRNQSIKNVHVQSTVTYSGKFSDQNKKFIPDGKYNNMYKFNQGSNYKRTGSPLRNKAKPLKAKFTVFETPKFKYAKHSDNNINEKDNLQRLNDTSNVDNPVQDFSRINDDTAEHLPQRTDDSAGLKKNKQLSPVISLVEMQKFKRASYETAGPLKKEHSSSVKKEDRSKLQIERRACKNVDASVNTDVLRLQDKFLLTYKIVKNGHKKKARKSDELKETEVGFKSSDFLLEHSFLNTPETLSSKPVILSSINETSMSSLENVPEETVIDCQLQEKGTISTTPASKDDLDSTDLSKESIPVLFFPSKKLEEIDSTECQSNIEVSSTKQNFSEVKEDYVHDTTLNRFVRRRKTSSCIGINGEILFGYYPVLIALQNKRRDFHKIYLKEFVTDTSRQLQIERLASERGIELEFVDVPTLDKICERPVHQGICADVSSLDRTYYSGDIEAISEEFVTGSGTPPLWLVIDSVHDPMNFGAILRSAYFFGVDRIFHCKRNSCKLSPVVSKSSAGILELLDIYTLQDIHTFLQMSKGKGWQIVGTCGINKSKSVIDLKTFRLESPTILVVGNEAKGMIDSLSELCDHLVTVLPANNLHPSVDSLNVGVATGVILSHLLSREPLN